VQVDEALRDARQKLRAKIAVTQSGKTELESLIERTRNLSAPGLDLAEDTKLPGSLVFGIGAMAAGFAGIVNAPVVSLTPEVGESILVQAFVVIVIGGVGSFPGAVLGGLALGLIESLGAGYLSSAYKDVFAFLIIIAALVFLPNGLLGRRAAERV